MPKPYPVDFPRIDPPELPATLSPDSLVEGVARVVALDGPIAWLEPEQGSSCGSCGSAGSCGAGGMGSASRRLAARRFTLADHPGLRVGERVVVGVRGDALLKAALTAYAMPLLAMLIGAGLAEWLGAGDGLTLVGAIAGLTAGLGLARLWAARLADKGATAPRYLRRAGPESACRLP